MNLELVEDKITQEALPSTSTYNVTSSGTQTLGYYPGPPLNFTTSALDNAGSHLETRDLAVLDNSDSSLPQILDSISETDTWDKTGSSEDPKNKSESGSSVHSQVSDDKDRMEVDSSSNLDEMCAKDIPELVKLSKDLLGKYHILKMFFR